MSPQTPSSPRLQDSGRVLAGASKTSKAFNDAVEAIAFGDAVGLLRPVAARRAGLYPVGIALTVERAGMRWGAGRSPR